MQPQEISIEVPSQGARRATGEGSNNGWKKPQRFSAQKKIEVVLRLLRGEALDLLLESGSATLVITNDGKPHGELGFDDLVAATASGSMSSRNDQ